MCALRPVAADVLHYKGVHAHTSAISAMKKIFLLLSFVSLCLLTACGGGNGNNSNSGFGGGGSSSSGFSLSSLTGQYTFQITGIVDGAPSGGQFTESAVFTADGKGNIGNGTEDAVPGNPATGAFTGTYTIASDGTGFITLNTGEEFGITLASTTKFYLSEIDGSANASGVGEQQTAAALTATPSGTFVFRIHNNGALINSTQVSLAQVGVMTVSSGSFTGTEDVLSTGTGDATLPITGSLNAPTAGRGSGTLNDANGTLSFEYYVVNANTINIMPFALNAVSIFGNGRAELQSGSPFSNTSLAGGYAFGSKGDTANIGGVQRVGQFNASNGTLTSGAEDFGIDGASGANDSFTAGSYTVGSNGRVALNATSSSLGAVPIVGWLVSPSRAFFLVNSTTRVEDGSMDAQGSGFSTNALTGQSAFFMSGFNSTVFADRIGTLTWSNGSVVASLVEVDTGSATSGSVTTPYSVASNGRTTLAIAGLPSVATANLTFYLSNNGSGYGIESDGNTEIGGTMTTQTQ